MAKPVGYGGRDYPDFGISDTVLTKSIITDMGELAARLGAPNVFDRMGNIVWSEQFEYGLGSWQLGSTGGGLDPVLVAHPYLYKPYALKFASEAGSTGGSITQINLHLPYESALGIEFAFNPNFRATTLELYINVYTGAKYYAFGAEFQLKNGIIRLYKQGGGYNNVYSNPLGYTRSDNYHVVKLVMDLANGLYKRLMFGNLDIDVTGKTLHVGTSGTRPSMTLLFRLESAADYDEVLFLDNVIITLDEPV